MLNTNKTIYYISLTLTHPPTHSTQLNSTQLDSTRRVCVCVSPYIVLKGFGTTTSRQSES